MQCYEGIVQVRAQNIERRLTAGQTYSIIDGTFSEGQTNLTAPQWTLNKSSFDNIPYKEVIAELERQYDVEIEIDSADVDRFFTGGFIHNNLDQALKSVTIPMNLTYTMDSSKRIQIHAQK